MPFLVVTGRGSWSFEGQRFRNGVHEVSDEVADAAERSGIRSLVVSAVEPEVIHREEASGPLSLDDIKIGTEYGVRLASDIVEEQLVEEAQRDYTFQCHLCPAAKKSSGALDRHIEFHHAPSTAFGAGAA